MKPSVICPRRSAAVFDWLARNVAILLFAGLLFSVFSVHAADTKEDRWITTWTAALIKPTFVFQNIGNYGFDNQTIRTVVFTSAGGDAVRIRLSNRHGRAPLHVGKVAIGVKRTPFNADLIPGRIAPLAFDGAEAVVIPPGEEIVSDPVGFEVLPHQTLVVDIHFPGKSGPVGYNFLTNTTNFVARGDRTGDTSGDAFTTRLDSWYVLSGVEVKNSAARGLIVACCDSVSITGQKDASMRWPEILSRRLQRQYGETAPSVVQTTLSGQRLLTSSNYAPSVLERFQRDVLEQPGVSKVILFVGVNDFGIAQMPDIDLYRPTNDVTVEQMIEGFKQVVAMARERNIQIYGATITPGSGYVHHGHSYWTPAQEAKRRALNEWIRQTDIFDAVFDFARAVQNPLDEEYYAPWASPDNIHPGDGGQYAMAMEIDLATLMREKEHKKE